MLFTFKSRPFGRHSLRRHPNDPQLLSLSMEMHCPNCGSDNRHYEPVDKDAAEAAEVHRTDLAQVSLPHMTYPELRELNERAATLLANPPVHTIEDCFGHLRTQIEDLRDTINRLEDGSDY